MLVCGSWARAALWAVTLLYLPPYDRWGARAAAPLLLPTLVPSAVWVPGEAPWLYHTLRYRWRA